MAGRVTMEVQLELTVAWQSDVGRQREHNEDAVAVHEPDHAPDLRRQGRLYLVADGLGGHLGGEMASRFVTQRLIELYVQGQAPQIPQRLLEAIHQVNAELFNKGAESPIHQRMGTTLVAAAVHGDLLTLAAVGDSRAYQVRDGAIQQLTQDHSLTAELLRAGQITPAQARTHPYRTVITQSVGVQAALQPDLTTQQLRAGDVLVLCTDGLWGQVEDQEILAIVSRQDPALACQALVALANERGGPDNISLLIIRVGPYTSANQIIARTRLPRVSRQ